jgi:hypothetical protein
VLPSHLITVGSTDTQDLLKNVRKEQGQPVDDVPTEEIVPEPGWVGACSPLVQVQISGPNSAPWSRQKKNSLAGGAA